MGFVGGADGGGGGVGREGEGGVVCWGGSCGGCRSLWLWDLV